MNRFIFKIILFLIFIGISIAFLVSKRTSFFVQNFQSVNGKYDIINLGTSHGGGIKYNVINDSNFRGYGFQRAGNTLYYDYQNYKYLKPYLKEGTIVIIPLSYFSFGLDENRTDYSDSNAFVNEFYFYLPNDFIYNYSFRKKVDVYLNKSKLNFKSIINDRFSINKPSPASLLSIHQHAEFAVGVHRRMGNYSDPKKNIVYLSSLIEDILKNKFKPVLITTPYFEEYNFKFGDAWLASNYNCFIDIIIKKYEIPYLNYSKDERISPNIKFFKNSDHLNQNGAKYFSRILFQDLKELSLFNNI